MSIGCLAAPNMTETNYLFVGEFSELITSGAKDKIAFHVKCCMNKGRDLQETLRRVYMDHGFKPQVEFIATNAFINGL